MNEHKNYLKLVNNERRIIDQQLKDIQIGYKDSMFKIESVLKTVTKEIEGIKECHDIGMCSRKSLLPIY